MRVRTFNIVEFFLLSVIIFFFFYFSLSEVVWRSNAALHKLPAVSSVHENRYAEWGPNFATNGLFHTGDFYITHTGFETNPWIMINFNEILVISFIRVYIRGNLGKLTS